MGTTELIDLIRVGLPGGAGLLVLLVSIRWMRSFQLDIGASYQTRVHEQENELAALRIELGKARFARFECDAREAGLRALCRLHSIDIPAYLLPPEQRNRS